MANILIRLKIYQFYEEHKVSSLLSLVERLSEDDCDVECCNTTLWCILHNCELLLKKSSHKRIIVLVTI